MVNKDISNDGHAKAAELSTQLSESHKKQWAAEDKLKDLVAEIKELIAGAEFGSGYISPGELRSVLRNTSI